MQNLEHFPKSAKCMILTKFASYLRLRLGLRLIWAWGWSEVVLNLRLSWNLVDLRLRWFEFGLSWVEVELRANLGFHSVWIMVQKSQNCVKAAIAFVFTTCNRQLLLTLLQLITFVCTTAIHNLLELVADIQRTNIKASRAPIAAKTTSTYFVTITRIET